MYQCYRAALHVLQHCHGFALLLPTNACHLHPHADCSVPGCMHLEPSISRKFILQLLAGDQAHDEDQKTDDQKASSWPRAD